MLTFDEQRHAYEWDGKPVPHVTGVIGFLTDYSRIPPDALERARQQGVAVHRMVELDCRDDLDVESLPEWMAGYYAAWRKFVAETGFRMLLSEQRVYHAKLGYAGTLDLCGVMERIDSAPAIIDIKRSLYAGPAIGLQLAAYQDALTEIKATRRYALQLQESGTYRLTEFKDRSDLATFLACLTIYRWRERHGKSD